MTAIEQELFRVGVRVSPHPSRGPATHYELAHRVTAFRSVGAGGVEVWKLVDNRVSHLAKAELITSVSHLRELLKKAEG